MGNNTSRQAQAREIQELRKSTRAALDRIDEINFNMRTQDSNTLVFKTSLEGLIKEVPILFKMIESRLSELSDSQVTRVDLDRELLAAKNDIVEYICDLGVLQSSSPNSSKAKENPVIFYSPETLNAPQIDRDDIVLCSREFEVGSNNDPSNSTQFLWSPGDPNLIPSDDSQTND